MMTFSQATLLGRTMMSEVSFEFREDTVDGGWSHAFWFSLIPIVAIGTALVIYRWFNQRNSEIYEPRGLLLELCREHELSRTVRIMLGRITSIAELSQPAVIMVSPELFEATIERASDRGGLKFGDGKRLEQLRQLLFN